MDTLNMTTVVLFLVSLLSAVLDTDAFRGGVGGATAHGRLVVCYVSTWSVYRPGKGSWDLSNLDPTLCTHLVYAFAGLDNRTNSIRSLDEFHDLEDNYGKGNFKKMTALKNRYPHLKVSIAIGGWNEGSTNYSIMVSSPATRKAFISSVSDFLRKYGFDGLDLDWEYPAKRGGAITDKQNFVQLVKELREEFDKHGWLLTAALGVAQDTIDSGYDLKSLGQYLDYMHAMCYDLHGAWDRQVGPNAPLKSNTPDDKLTVEYAIKYMMKLGAPARKLVLGVPFYGRTFIMKDEDAPSVLGSPAEEKGFPGPYTKEDGFMGYNEICVNISSGTWKTFWDDVSMTPYAVQDLKVITYDNEKSIAEKVKFAVKLDLAGLMVWSIDTDDFHGDCMDAEGKVTVNYPLMKTISRTISEELQKRQEEEEHSHHDHSTESNSVDEDGQNAIDSGAAVVSAIVSLVLTSALHNILV